MTSTDDLDDVFQALKAHPDMAADVVATEPGIRAVNAAIRLAQLGSDPAPGTLAQSQALHQVLADTVRTQAPEFLAALLTTFEELHNSIPTALEACHTANSAALDLIRALRAEGVIPATTAEDDD